MAVIQKIRDRYITVALFAVGFALVAFLLSDALTGNNSIFGGRDKNSVGTIKGTSIDVNEFEVKMKAQEEIMMKQNPKTTIDDATREQIREQVWNQLVTEQILEPEYDRLGFQVTESELKDAVLGPDPHPAIKNAFKDSFGNFTRGMAQKQIQYMIDDEGDAHEQWLNFETGLTKDRIREKYNAIVKSSAYVTTFEAKKDFIDANRKVDAQYVSQQYANVPDSVVKVTEADKKNWYNENIEKFKREDEERKVEFVVFDIVPSATDSQELSKWSVDKYSEFKDAKNDSTFLVNNEGIFDKNFKKKEDLDPEIKDTLANSSPGSIFGPYINGGSIKVTKLIKTSYDTSVTYHSRHILIKPKGSSPMDSMATQAKATMYMNLIKSGKMTFKQASDSISEDPGAKVKDGDLGEVGPGAMVKPFEDAAKKLNKGEMTTCITQFGYHIIQAVDNPKSKYEKKFMVATLSKKFEPSPSTIDNIFNAANQFARDATNVKDFDAKAKENKYTVRLAENLNQKSRNLPGLTSPKELVNWAFNAKKGEVHEPFLLGDKYVVAVVAEIKPKGYKKMDELVTEVSEGATKDVKAKYLIEKFNKNLANVKTPLELALSFQSIAQPATGVNFANPRVEYIGSDPKVISAILKGEKDKFSKPIKGENGVYVIYVTSVTDPANMPQDFTKEKNEKIDGMKNSIEYEVFEALKKKGKVKDERYKFY